MQYLNATDLLVRKQLILQKLSCLGNEYTEQLRLGQSCTKDTLEDIIFLRASLDLIECYNPIGNTNTGNIFTSGDIEEGAVIEFLVNGVSISGPFTFVSGSDLIDAITAYQASHGNFYVCTLAEDELSYDITSNYCGTGGELQMFNHTPDISFPVLLTGMTNNVCLLDNCITEKEIQTLFDTIVWKYKLCFMPIGFSYSS